MSARDNILSRLRNAPGVGQQTLPDVASWYLSHQRNENHAQRIARLRKGLEANRTEVHDTTASDWPTLLLHIAASKNLRTLLIGSNTAHGKMLEAASASD